MKDETPDTDTVKSLKDLTPQMISFFVKKYSEKIYFPHLKIEQDEFKPLEERFSQEDDPAFEYFANDKEIVLLSPPTPIHQHIQSALEGWLNDVGEELSTSQHVYFAQNAYAIKLADGSSKVPDTALVTSTLGSYPVVAVEVGFTESLEKLYRDAEVLLRGSRARIELVILLKVNEGNHQHLLHDAYPWGETEDHLQSMTHDSLVSTIEAFCTSNHVEIMGDLTVDAYLYPKGRETRPRKPVHTFVYPGLSSSSSSSALVEAEHPPMVPIKGQEFRFPVKKIKVAIERGVALQKTSRVLGALGDAGLL